MFICSEIGAKSFGDGSQDINLVPRVSLLCLPWSLEEKTLVAAGHVTTQNLGGKKIYWMRGVAECFVCCCDKLCGFQSLERSLKATRSIRDSKSNNATRFLLSSKYRRLSFERSQRNSAAEWAQRF